jgi:[ribosomal protein S5]-alanine N-acetyltransferase
MLRIPTFPPSYDDILRWFRQNCEEWADGKAYRFAILDQGGMVGLVDIESVADGEGALGYWLEGFVRATSGSCARHCESNFSGRLWLW